MSESNNPLQSLWASMSRPPLHSTALELSPFHDDSPSQLWNFDDQSSYPTPLEKFNDQMISHKPMPPVDIVGEHVGTSLFESLLVANTIGSQINVQNEEFSAGRHRSFSQSFAIPNQFTGMEKTIKCPYCDKLFYKKYNLKSHLVSHSSNS